LSFGECLGGWLEVQAFVGDIVEALNVPLEGGLRDELEVSYCWAASVASARWSFPRRLFARETMVIA